MNSMHNKNKLLQWYLQDFSLKLYSLEINHVINKEPNREELTKLEIAIGKMYSDTYLETIGLKENKNYLC